MSEIIRNDINEEDAYSGYVDEFAHIGGQKGIKVQIDGIAFRTETV